MADIPRKGTRHQNPARGDRGQDEGRGGQESTVPEEAAESGGEERISRDERNLATYPITLLSYQTGPGKVIRLVRERKHPVTKKTIQAIWQVEGGAQVGLPTPPDEAVLLVLLEISREAGWPVDVYFTRYDVLQRLGWPDNQQSYKKLFIALRRLQALTVTSENVFWDKGSGAFVSTAFHIIESFEFVKSRAGRKKKTVEAGANLDSSLSRFTWSKVLWQSFKDGNLKPLNLSLIFSFKLPVTRRLFRFLDLVKYDGKRRYEIGLNKLCEEYLNIAPAKYPSLYKNTLDPAHAELIERGFLESVHYQPARSQGGEKVVYTFGDVQVARQTAEQLLADEQAELLGTACDAVWEQLPTERRQAMEQEIMAGWMPGMAERLSDPDSIAAHEHRRLIRLSVQREYLEEVQKRLSQP